MVAAAIRTYGAGLLEVPTVTMELTVGAGMPATGESRPPGPPAAAASLPGLDPVTHVRLDDRAWATR